VPAPGKGFFSEAYHGRWGKIATVWVKLTLL
jgi:hypothetical protein